MSPTVKTFLALVVALPALLAFGATSHVLTGRDVSRALLAQMNSSPAGHITKNVDCRLVAQSKAHGPVQYACVLTGRRATQRALVTVTGGSWRAEFAPLQG